MRAILCGIRALREFRSLVWALRGPVSGSTAPSAATTIHERTEVTRSSIRGRGLAVWFLVAVCSTIGMHHSGHS